ncbi:hypothetical protein Poli38472_006932 [Pythium oligandrum]|uniref:Uncharacterized protein n=1 Tax=Pythium oligandrum TaxID=41045 RepID=A0A8K1FGK1_PYTOL|nr:hypothetical protein Poli38472_006932 [Pythium oligandrum]|eukprot:TMW58787.1 hypothetical protein Poli38472_006932 [Pythium oligandrum]
MFFRSNEPAPQSTTQQSQYASDVPMGTVSSGQRPPQQAQYTSSDVPMGTVSSGQQSQQPHYPSNDVPVGASGGQHHQQQPHYPSSDVPMGTVSSDQQPQQSSEAYFARQQRNEPMGAASSIQQPPGSHNAHGHTPGAQYANQPDLQPKSTTTQYGQQPPSQSTGVQYGQQPDQQHQPSAAHYGQPQQQPQVASLHHERGSPWWEESNSPADPQSQYQNYPTAKPVHHLEEGRGRDEDDAARELRARREAQDNVNCEKLAFIICAILLPPLGVFLQAGCHKDLAINLLLTILGYIPGILHALYVILTK